MIYHLLYVSEETAVFDGDKDLDQILSASREKNHRSQITGILIKNGKFFIQLLEGSRTEVERVYKHISKDPRHTKIRTLLDYQDSLRIFPDWAMGFVKGEKDEPRLAELIPYLHENLMNVPASKEKVVTILKRFNDR